MRMKAMAGVVGLLATLLVFSVVGAIFPAQNYGQGSSDVWVMNLNETEDANVVAAYIDQNGNPDATVGATIDPLGNTSFPASSSGLADDCWAPWCCTRTVSWPLLWSCSGRTFPRETGGAAGCIPAIRKVRTRSSSRSSQGPTTTGVS